MSRFTLAAVSAAALAVAGAAWGAAPARPTAANVFCAKQVTMLFWPHGNKDLSKIGQPAVPFAHLDIYKSFAATYPLQNFLGWAAAGKTPSSTPSPYVGPNCIDYATIGKPSPIASQVRLTQAARVLCSFPRSVVIQIDKLSPYRYHVRVLSGASTLVADGIVARSGSTLTYAGRSCQRKAPPT